MSVWLIIESSSLSCFSFQKGLLFETVKSLEELKENEKYINFDEMKGKQKRTLVVRL